jgi:hypothetical protein
MSESRDWLTGGRTGLSSGHATGVDDWQGEAWQGLTGAWLSVRVPRNGVRMGASVLPVASGGAGQELADDVHVPPS